MVSETAIGSCRLTQIIGIASGLMASMLNRRSQDPEWMLKRDLQGTADNLSSLYGVRVALTGAAMRGPGMPLCG